MLSMTERKRRAWQIFWMGAPGGLLIEGVGVLVNQWMLIIGGLGIVATMMTGMWEVYGKYRKEVVP